MKTPMDLAIECVEEKLERNPEALAQLGKLKTLHNSLERIKLQLEKAQSEYHNESKIMLDILDILNTTSYKLNTFQARVRTSRSIEIVDTQKFMAWLKENCEPGEIMGLLTPPCTLANVKKFIEFKHENTTKFDFEIEGVITKSIYRTLKTEYIGEKYGRQKESYKKENKKSYKLGSNSTKSRK